MYVKINLEGIEIVRILHSSQDIETIFQDED
jgi:plasmid stabilization system protein ParE